jgi:hypothetical protein
LLPTVIELKRRQVEDPKLVVAVVFRFVIVRLQPRGSLDQIDIAALTPSVWTKARPETMVPSSPHNDHQNRTMRNAG